MPAFNRWGAIALTVVVAAATAGCANHAQMQQPVQTAQGVQYGQVQSIDIVRAQSQTTGTGAVIGGVIGAVIGNQIGGGTGHSAATGVGAVGGAIIGNEIEKNQRGAQDFQRVVVRLDSGVLRSFDLPGASDLRIGDRVRVENNQILRM